MTRAEDGEGILIASNYQKNVFREFVIISFAFLALPSAGFCSISPEMINEIEDHRGRAVLSEDWLFLTRIQNTDNQKSTDIYMGKDSALIQSNRIDFTYRIREDKELDYYMKKGAYSCRHRGCYTKRIEVTEYLMDCLSRKLQKTSWWSFVVYIDPYTSYQRVKMRDNGMWQEFNMPWKPIPEQSVHAAVAGAQCKNVLPRQSK